MQWKVRQKILNFFFNYKLSDKSGRYRLALNLGIGLYTQCRLKWPNRERALVRINMRKRSYRCTRTQPNPAQSWLLWYSHYARWRASVQQKSSSAGFWVRLWASTCVELRLHTSMCVYARLLAQRESALSGAWAASDSIEVSVSLCPGYTGALRNNVFHCAPQKCSILPRQCYFKHKQKMEIHFMSNDVK
jgi:hypothetical protein